MADPDSVYTQLGSLHRDTSEAVEATRALIRQMAKRAESRGIDFYRSQSQSVNSSGLPITEN